MLSQEKLLWHFHLIMLQNQKCVVALNRWDAHTRCLCSVAVCSKLLLTFPTLPSDEGDVRQEQRFLPDGRRPAERHGRAWGSVLAGHSAAPPAHREGTKHLNTDLQRLRHPENLKTRVSLFEHDFTVTFPYQRRLISINDSVIIWPAAQISGFQSSVFFFLSLACSRSKTPHPLEFGDITNPPTLQLQRPIKRIIKQLHYDHYYYCYCYSRVSCVIILFTSGSRDDHIRVKRWISVVATVK